MGLSTALYAVLSYAPASVVAFGGLALLIGVLVLVHTQHLVATADIPRSSLGTTSPVVKPDVPQVRADASNCSELWFEQRIDHFSWLAAEALDRRTPVRLLAACQPRTSSDTC